MSFSHKKRPNSRTLLPPPPTPTPTHPSPPTPHPSPLPPPSPAPHHVHPLLFCSQYWTPVLLHLQEQTAEKTTLPARRVICGFYYSATVPDTDGCIELCNTYSYKNQQTVINGVYGVILLFHICAVFYGSVFFLSLSLSLSVSLSHFLSLCLSPSLSLSLCHSLCLSLSVSVSVSLSLSLSVSVCLSVCLSLCLSFFLSFFSFLFFLGSSLMCLPCSVSIHKVSGERERE